MYARVCDVTHYMHTLQGTVCCDVCPESSVLGQQTCTECRCSLGKMVFFPQNEELVVKFGSSETTVTLEVVAPAPRVVAGGGQARTWHR